MATTVTKVTRMAGGDELLVYGTVDGVEVKARGWVSATTNHFPATAYNADGSRKISAASRTMAAGEKLAYAKRLLEEQNAPVVAPAEVDLGISG